MQELSVHALPSQVEERELSGSTVIVIDLLRATSTICQALAAGAHEVVPFLEIDDTVVAADAAGRTGIVLGGERRGGKIPGFDLGNSPAEYTPEVVGGKRVFITTTNGTRALDHARMASRILVGSLLNLSAIAASLRNEPQVDILCAGTDGDETREDILGAGAFAKRLTMDQPYQMNEKARAALAEWEAAARAAQLNGRELAEQLAIELRNTPGGRNLIGIGLDQDLVDCAQIDRYRLVPQYDVRAGRITAK
jgi:2-phosphosulfolactate phosphatase